MNPDKEFQSYLINILLLILSIVILSTPLLVFYEDWAGWILFYVNFIIVGIYGLTQKNIKLTSLLILSVFIHNFASILNAYFIPLFDSTMDAAIFNLTALEIAQSNEITFAQHSLFYPNFLALFYLINPSIFFGQELSVLAFTLCCITLHKLHAFLKLKHSLAVMLIFGLYPTWLIWYSFTMREAWELLLFMLLIYQSVKWISLRKKKNFILMAILALMITLTHKVFALLSPLLILLATLYYMKTNSKNKIIILFLFSLIILSYDIFMLNFSASSHLIETIANQRNKVIYNLGIHTYDYQLIDTSSYLGILYSFGRALTYYISGPFFWQIKDTAEFLIMLQSLCRLILLLCAFNLWRSAEKDFRKLYGYLLVVYFISSFAWSLGVVNYGTAIRHQSTIDWIVVLLGLPFLLELLKFRDKSLVIAND